MILGTILPHLPSITHPGLILLALLVHPPLSATRTLRTTS